MDVMAAVSPQLRPLDEGYFATEEGTIWSFWRPNGIGPHKIRRDLPPRPLKAKDNGRGYKTVILKGRGDQYIHRLMWEAWYGHPGNLQVRHYDGDRGNNAISNLRLGTQVQNEADKERHGLVPRGSNHKNSRLTEEQVVLARGMWIGGASLKTIYETLGARVTRATLHEAVTGRTWKHLNKKAPPSMGGHRSTRPDFRISPEDK